MQARTMIWAGICGLLFGAVGGLILLFPARSQVGPTARSEQSRDHLRGIVVGVLVYESLSDQLFPGSTSTTTVPSVRLHCWQTHLLPHIDEAALHAGINLDLPWNEPRNLPPLSHEVTRYSNPGVGGTTHDRHGRALTHYAGNTRLLVDGPPLAIRDISDGVSLTLFAGEVTASHSRAVTDL